MNAAVSGRGSIGHFTGLCLGVKKTLFNTKVSFRAETKSAIFFLHPLGVIQLRGNIITGLRFNAVYYTLRHAGQFLALLTKCYTLPGFYTFYTFYQLRIIFLLFASFSFMLFKKNGSY